jgi:hypothetical protein
MKNNTQTSKENEEHDNEQATSDGQSGGVFGGLMGGVEGVQQAADAAKEAQNQSRGMAGSINDMVGSVTDVAEAAKREGDRQEMGKLGPIGDLAQSATDLARETGSQSGQTSGPFGLGTGETGATERKWRGAQEAGVTYDASGRRVDQGAEGGLTDSLIGGVTDLADAANQAADTAQQDEGEWRSLSGTDDAVGSEAYEERLRQAHEAAGSGWYPSSVAASEDEENQGGA